MRKLQEYVLDQRRRVRTATSADKRVMQLRAENDQLAERLRLACLEFESFPGKNPRSGQEIEMIDSMEWARVELQALGEKLIAKRTQQAKLDREASARRDEIEAVEASLSEGREVERELSVSAEEQRSEIERLRDERAVLKSATKSARSEAERLKEAQQTAHSELGVTEVKLQGSRDSLAQLRLEIEESEELLEARRASLETVDEERMCLLVQLKSVQTSLGVCSEDTVEKTAELQRAEEAIERAITEKAAIGQEVDEARILRTKLSERTDELRSQIEFASKQLREIREKKRELEKGLAKAEPQSQNSLNTELELLGFQIRGLRQTDS